MKVVSKVNNVYGQVHHHIGVITPCASSFPHTGVTNVPQMNAIPMGLTDLLITSLGTVNSISFKFWTENNYNKLGDNHDEDATG